jgi:hypothetical protein
MMYGRKWNLRLVAGFVGVFEDGRHDQQIAAHKTKQLA